MINSALAGELQEFSTTTSRGTFPHKLHFYRGLIVPLGLKRGLRGWPAIPTGCTIPSLALRDSHPRGQSTRSRFPAVRKPGLFATPTQGMQEQLFTVITAVLHRLHTFLHL